MESGKMTVGDIRTNRSGGLADIGELVKEQSIVNSFYVEGLIGIFICSFVVLAIIAVILYYVIPCRK